MRHVKGILNGILGLTACAVVAVWAICAMLYYPFRPPRDPNEWIDPV